MGDTEGYGSASTPDRVAEKAVHQPGSDSQDGTEFGETENIDIGKGVHQGCILSPLLFNIYAENIMREAWEEWNQPRSSAGLRSVEAPGQQCYRKFVDVKNISTY